MNVTMRSECLEPANVHAWRYNVFKVCTEKHLEEVLIRMFDEVFPNSEKFLELVFQFLTDLNDTDPLVMQELRIQQVFDGVKTHIFHTAAKMIKVTCASEFEEPMTTFRRRMELTRRVEHVTFAQQPTTPQWSFYKDQEEGIDII